GATGAGMPGRQRRAVATAAALQAFPCESAERDEGVGQRGEDQEQDGRKEDMRKVVQGGFERGHRCGARVEGRRALARACRQAPVASRRSRASRAAAAWFIAGTTGEIG